MTRTGISTSNDSQLWIVGVDEADPDTVFVRVSYQVVGSVSDALYRSRDGGATWTKVFAVNDQLSAVLRANGELVVAGYASGIHRSLDGGDAWTDVPTPPMITCLTESAAGEVWACTNNVGIEDAAIMKSTDLATWTPMLHYRDILGPVECPAGTIQRDACTEEPGEWCVVRANVGVVANPTGCVSEVPQPDLPVIDAPGDGCCRAGGGESGAGVALYVVVAVTRRRPTR